MSTSGPNDMIEAEMDEITAVLAEGLENGDSQIIRGIQRFGATNWTVVMTPGQIMGTLLRMAAEEGRDWCVIDDEKAHRDPEKDEVRFWRYLHDDLETGRDYLIELYENDLMEVKIPESMEILVDNAASGGLNSQDKRIKRGLTPQNESKIEELLQEQNPSNDDQQRVIRSLKDNPDNWTAIRLHQDTWNAVLSELDHEYPERIHTHSLGNVFGMSVRGEGESIYRSIRNIVHNFSGESVNLEDLRKQFTKVGRQDRFDFWVRHEQQLRDPLRLITFEDGLRKVVIDRDRAAERALERINERARDRFQRRS